MVTHLEPNTLECEVKWALGNITTNKASGGDAIPVELFQIIKDDAVKVLHSICQQIWKTQQGKDPHWRKLRSSAAKTNLKIKNIDRFEGALRGWSWVDRHPP